MSQKQNLLFTDEAAKQRETIRSTYPDLIEEMDHTEAAIRGANPHPPFKSGEKVVYTCTTRKDGSRVITKVERMRTARAPRKRT